MELQENLEYFKDNHIQPYAISYDPVSTLCEFAKRHDIQVPLLADTDSSVIRQFGILNSLVPEDHRWYGIPFPGTFMVDSAGKVSDKSFYADHQIRDSVPRMLTNSFSVDDVVGLTHEIETEDLSAKASLTSPSIRRGQVQTFTLDIQIREGRHLYGRPLPDGYIPTSLTFENIEDVNLSQVTYPAPKSQFLPALKETIPVYEGSITLKSVVQNRRREDFTIRAKLEYQACDDQTCYLPTELNFEIPVTYLENAK